MCSHPKWFATDYGTRVCKQCGYEVKIGLPTSDMYTTNCPLVVGYSRNSRVKCILEQLFEPFMYGKPCQEIVYIIKRDKLRFESGKDLHEWLNNQTVKNKKYTCCHYYFAIANHCWYKVPPPPSKDRLLVVLRAFHTLESLFNGTEHPFKSFFSYNWLLRKLLLNCQLEHYVQFIKPIKCKGRRQMYLKMFKLLPTLRNSCIRVADQAHVLSSPQPLFLLQDYAEEVLRQLSSGVSDLSIKSLRNRLRGLT